MTTQAVVDAHAAVDKIAVAATKTPFEVANEKAGAIMRQRDADRIAVAPGAPKINYSMKFEKHPDGRFTIEGSGFGGSPGGSVTVGGKPVPVIRWHDSIIEGVLPTDVTGGEVIVDGPAGRSVGKA